MWKNKIMRGLKAEDDALIIGIGILIVLGIIGIVVLSTFIMNIAIGMLFVAIALIVIAVAVKSLKKAFGGTGIGTKTGSMLRRLI